MPNCAPLYKSKPKPKTNWSKWQAKKGSRHERGYGNDWDKLRKVVLRRDKNLCQSCYKLGRLSEASAVDHIKPKAKGGTDDLSNLQAICKPCHNRKTATD